VIHPYSYYVARAATRWPDKAAVVDGERSLTYAELDGRIGRLAAGLRVLGLERGERVAILQENGHRYVESVCAVARAGGVFVPMLGVLGDRDHADIAADCGARMVVALSPEGGSRVARLRDTVPDLRIIAPGDAEHDYEALLDSHQPEERPVDSHPDDLAQILYTSGTTGRPKGVMHSFSSTSAAMAAWVSGLGFRHDDRALGHFALSHFGGRVMDASWCVGATLVILPRPDPVQIIAAVAAQRITVLLMIPTLLRMLVDLPAVASHDLSSLRVLLYAAAPASAGLVRRAMELFGPILVTGFGQTEAYGLNTVLSAADHRTALEAGGERLASIGREADTGVQVRLLDRDRNPVAVGATGEICVSAPWVMTGYWNRPELTERTVGNGWLHTRDLGRKDSDGYFYIVDREDDMIISGGYNIAPREIEDVIGALPGVKACCVVGVPDPKWGEAVRAVVIAEGVNAEEIIASCKAQLAAFKVPKAVEFVSALPTSGVGKILRRAVREKFWSGREQRVHGAE
jgi:fatty-acyl-CoA synthase/long-chain acyl-CoA synthetase